MFKTILALALVGAAAAQEGNCPTCEHITDQAVCQTGRHPTTVGPHNQGCGPHGEPGAVYCAWNATLGKVTTPGCANCSAALGMAMAYEFCARNCIYSGPTPVVIQGCSLKGGPDCKTNGPNGGPSGNYQWTCYNPDSVNANHTAWIPGSRHYCRANAEIKTILTTCERHKGGCLDGGCPPPRPGPDPGPPPSPSPPGPGPAPPGPPGPAGRCDVTSFGSHHCSVGLTNLSSAAITTAAECSAAGCAARPAVNVTYIGFNDADNSCFAGDWHQSPSCRDSAGWTTFLVNFKPGL